MNSKQLEQLNRAIAIAKAKGGLCLSQQYIDSRAMMTWKCHKNEHPTWAAKFTSVVNDGKWCPKCKSAKQAEDFKNPIALETARAHAKANGGICLSTEYKSAEQNLLWKCSCLDHQPWESSFKAVVRCGAWCPACVAEKKRKALQNRQGLLIAHQVAQSRGGKCLSTEYINANTKMLWHCSNANHSSWLASYSQVVNKRNWCPECGKKNISEMRVRLILETFFGKPFAACKPIWNVNPWTNYLLELDGYCREFNVAFEHDGQHHYEVDAFNSGKKKKDLIYQKFRDEQKRKNCAANGVLLINVPILPKYERGKFQPFMHHVIQCCSSQGIDLTFDQTTLKRLESEFYAIK